MSPSDSSPTGCAATSSTGIRRADGARFHRSRGAAPDLRHDILDPGPPSRPLSMIVSDQVRPICPVSPSPGGAEA